VPYVLPYTTSLFLLRRLPHRLVPVTKTMMAEPHRCNAPPHGGTRAAGRGAPGAKTGQHKRLFSGEDVHDRRSASLPTQGRIGHPDHHNPR